MRNKIKQGNKLFRWTGAVLLMLYTVVFLGPLLWALLASVRDPLDFRFNMFGWPKVFAWNNYSTALKHLNVEVTFGVTVPFERMFFNTLVYAIGSTIIHVAANCVMAYVVSKYSKFKFTRIIYSYVIITMILPIIGSLPSEIRMVRSLGFYDNIFGVFIMKAGFGGMHFLIFYAAFKSVSWEYAEAAIMDGAGNFQIFIKIMAPMARTVIFALALLAFIGYWNDFQTPMIYLPSMPTVAYGLYRFQFLSATGTAFVTVQLAATMLVTIPIFMIYICFKRFLTGNVAVGGIKG